MKTFAIVAIRLIGLWLIAGSMGIFVVLLKSVLPSNIPDTPGFGLEWSDTATMLMPIITGVALILFSRPLARFVVAGVADDAPLPDALTVRGFTQMGVFLLGLMTVLNGLPILIGSVIGGFPMGADQWIYVGLGALLIFVAVPLGKLIEQLRR